MPNTELTTLAEQTRFRRTGRYEEVERLCRAYAQRWPEAVRSFEFGCTPEGRPLMAMAVSRTGALIPREILRRKLPVLMLQAGIHPGESDGKDAGFMMLREILEGRRAAGALDRIVILFVPVFSADGHERFGPWNRANQNGPEEMGWRANAQNLNLNRDYTKADTPEMQAMLRLMNEWDPLLCADLHVSDGADFEHDVSIQVEPLNIGAPELFAIGRSVRQYVVAHLAEKGSLPLTYYPVLAQRDNPAGGFIDLLFTPRYSTGYWILRNRFALLVETHSWKEYARRVRVTGEGIVKLAELFAEVST